MHITLTFSHPFAAERAADYLAHQGGGTFIVRDARVTCTWYSEDTMTNLFARILEEHIDLSAVIRAHASSSNQSANQTANEGWQ